jgi:hypothetical protein
MGNGTSFEEAIGAFAVSYADQAQQDYAAFTSAIADGRLNAHEDLGGQESMQAAHGLSGLGQAPEKPAKQKPGKQSR